jgi:hypothetical protein
MVEFILFLCSFLSAEKSKYLSRCFKGQDMAFALFDLDNWLRSKVRYGGKYESVYQEVRDELWEELGSRGINLEDIT